MGGSFVSALICRAVGHDWEHTDEFENRDGHAQADKICTRCSIRVVSWTGPGCDDLKTDADTTGTVAEPSEYVQRALEADHYPEGAQRLLNHLWENPDEFASGLGDVEEQADRFGMQKEAYIAVMLGVVFGINYEHAYPTGRQDEWPVALDERPGRGGEDDG